MKIEFKEIKLRSSDIYTPSSYPSTGFYLVKLYEEPEPGRTMIYNDGTSALYLINLPYELFCSNYELFCSNEDTNSETSNEATNVNNPISEELFLKTLSLVVNKDESYK